MTTSPSRLGEDATVRKLGGQMNPSALRMPTEPPRRPRRTRTPRPADTAPAGYTQAWTLFADWCAATEYQALPADPATVIAFLSACPAATSTQRRRIAAIDHQHLGAGHPAPGDQDDVRAAVGRPSRERVWVCPDRTIVDAALRALPSHGFTAGLFGQRDRALLVLAQIAGLSYRAIAALTAADLHLDSDTRTFTITTGGRAHVIEAAGTAVSCPACVLARWMATHAVLTRYVATRPLADHLHHLDPVTDTSAHACRQSAPVATGTAPLLPSFNQWGHVPFPVTRLSPHAVSRQAHDLMTGELRLHRDLAVANLAADQPTDKAPREPAPPYRAADREAAWNRRRHELTRLAGVAAGLEQVEQRAAELDRRIIELLKTHAP